MTRVPAAAALIEVVMTIRITNETVVFRHPFRITGLDGTQAAGQYLVETDEEVLEAQSATRYRRVATHIRFGAGESGEVARIDPAELTAALARDIEAEDASPPSDDWPMPGGATRPMPGRLPRFRNDQGLAEIRIGARSFLCIGVTPPQDHPHVYIEMGAQDTILCPYCATLFRFDPHLGPFSAEPPDCLHDSP